MSAKNSLIADGGFWIALFNQRAPYHQRAVAALDQFLDRLLVITWPVVVETGHLLLQRAGFQAQLAFVQILQQGGADIFHLDDSTHLPRMIQLMQKISGFAYGYSRCLTRHSGRGAGAWADSFHRSTRLQRLSLEESISVRESINPITISA